MKNKKIIIAIVSAIILLMLIGIPLAFKSGNKVSFQSKEEMAEIINGVWQTGNSKFDFVLTVDGDIAYLSIGNKIDEPSKIILVPDNGYFYFESNGNEKDSRYNVIYDNGEYVIKTEKWEYRKQK